MIDSKNMQRGQVFVGSILLVILLIGVVVFIFFMIRRPSEEDYVAELGDTGLSLSEAQKAAEDIQRTVDKYPVSQVLPFGGPFDGVPFFIHMPTKAGVILVEIDLQEDFEATKEATLQWIEDQGHNPDEYNFTFKSSNFSD